MNASTLRFLAAAGLIIILTVLAYLPALQGPFLFDDVLITGDYPAIRSRDGLVSLWFEGELPNYEPLTYSVFWACWQLWGNETTGYHVCNVLLHALAAVLVWRILRRMEIPGAWLAGLAFALHPVNVESTAFIFQIRNTLSTALAFAAVLCYLRFHANQDRRWYAGAVGLFLLALLSKAAVVMLPLWLLGLVWWRERRLTGADLWRSAPFFALSVVMGLTEVWFQNHHAIGSWTIHDNGPLGRLAGAGWAFWFYIGKAVAPVELSFFYPRWTIDTSSPWSYVPLLGLVLAGWLAWRYRAKVGRSMVVGLGLYVIALVPVLGFLNIAFMRYSLVADHWQYMALASLVAVVVGTSAALVRSLRRSLQYGAMGVAGIIIVTLFLLTARRAALYADPELLYRDALAKNPDGAVCHFAVGETLDRQGRLDESIGYHLEAIRLDPTFHEAYINLGAGYARRGDVEAASRCLEEALHLQPGAPKPRLALAEIRRRQGRLEESLALYNSVRQGNQHFDRFARRGLGRTLLQLGEFTKAAEMFGEAVPDEEADAELHKDFGDALAAQGKYAAAVAQYKQALQLDERLATAHVGLGNVNARQRQPDAAIAQFQKSLELEPGLAAAHGAWADLCVQLGQFEEARKHYEDALRHNPNCVEAHAALGDLAARAQQHEKAIQHYREAVRLRPMHADLRKTLGDLLLSQGRASEAVAEYRAALEARPGWVAVAGRLAWLLATCEEAQLRNGPEAVRLAEQTCRQTGNRHPVALDTLAAAYAEAGRFSEAIQTAKQAVALARTGGEEALARDAEQRLTLYQRGLAFHTR
jgi:protein O-mannosyl-transferase